MPRQDPYFRYLVTTTLGSRVGALNPAWNDPDQDSTAGFHKAVAMVTQEFVDKVKRIAQVWWPAREPVKQALEKRFEVHSSGKVNY